MLLIVTIEVLVMMAFVLVFMDGIKQRIARVNLQKFMIKFDYKLDYNSFHSI